MMMSVLERREMLRAAEGRPGPARRRCSALARELRGRVGRVTAFLPPREMATAATATTTDTEVSALREHFYYPYNCAVSVAAHTTVRARASTFFWLTACDEHFHRLLVAGKT